MLILFLALVNNCLFKKWGTQTRTQVCKSRHTLFSTLEDKSGNIGWANLGKPGDEPGMNLGMNLDEPGHPLMVNLGDKPGHPLMVNLGTHLLGGKGRNGCPGFIQVLSRFLSRFLLST
jgi:hypothetical protein